MALSETIEYDKIEIVGEYKAVQVRKATVVKKDDTEIARSFNRYVLHPDSDISGQPTEVSAVCNAVWTNEVKEAWTKYQASLSPESHGVIQSYFFCFAFLNAGCQ